MSYKHKQYLKKLKRNKIIIITSQILILISIILLWQILADMKLINTFITSSPKQIINTIIGLNKSNNLYHHIWVTTYETIISFSLSCILGILIATILWRYKILARILEPYLTIINSLPKVALGPIILIWCGANIRAIIIMALLVSIIVTIINIYQGFIHVDNNHLKLMKSFKATRWQIYWKLIIPETLPNIISTIKISISMSLIGVIMGEFLVSKQGIGYLIMYGSQVFNLNLVISGIFLLTILATIMYYIINYFEKK